LYNKYSKKQLSIPEKTHKDIIRVATYNVHGWRGPEKRLNDSIGNSFAAIFEVIKNTNADLWDKIYIESTLLYDQMLDYQKRFPISPGEIQFWTAEMWSLLWNLWLHGYKTEITKELDFSWATDSIEIYEKRPILHMAGVTDDMKNRKFYKGEFINIDPIQKLKEDPNFFDFVENTSSTVKYIDNMKSYIKKYES
jgi:hypothetical protein